LVLPISPLIGYPDVHVVREPVIPSHSIFTTTGILAIAAPWAF
jgi:hypothetical protein